MSDLLKGVLIYTDVFGWKVRYGFGKNQFKCIHIHQDSIQDVQNNGKEGDEVFFKLKGTPAPRTLNGVATSARIIEKK
jgi:hypothetical protein